MDLSKLSNEELLAMSRGPDLSSISNEQLLAMARQTQPKPDTSVADGTSFGQAALIGTGRTVDRGLQGLKELALKAASPFSSGAKAALEAQAFKMAQDDEQYAKLTNARPGATMLGEIAPLLAAPMLGSGVAGAALSASLPGLISYGSTEERLKAGGMGAAGGLVGAGIGKGIGKLLQPSKGVPDAAIADAVEAAKRINYKPPAGQETGSRLLQGLEQQLAKNPIGSGTAQKFNEGNVQAVNSAAARAMGENATKLTDDVLASAEARIGQQFQEVAARNNVQIGPEFSGALAKLKAGQDEAGPFANKTIDVLVGRGMQLAERGEISGKAYQSIRSALGKQARDAFSSGRSELGGAIKTVQGALDNAADSSISAADQAAWKLAREQWQALKLVSTKNGVVEGGNVSAAKLATKVDKAGRVSSQELRDIAKIGETFKPLPDSGTAGNLMLQALLSGGAGLAGPGAMATSLALPYALSKGAFSDKGRKYLTKGLMDISPEAEKRLMRAGGGLLGLPATVGADR